MVKRVLGLIGGTVLPNTRLIRDGLKRQIDTPFGEVELFDCGRFVYLQRHGNGNIPPHRINHKANIYAIKSFTDSVIGVASVGSLKKSIKPNTLAVPEDYIDLNPPTYFDDEIRHITPSFDEGLRKHILEAAAWNKIKVFDGGVYIQSRGPRLETKAEVRMLAQFGDIVGMTVASEATLASELGLKYATICSVDNLANGLAKERLDFGEIKGSAEKNKAKVETLLEKIVEELK
jgi:5'-methylthioadenosine phosphorylase